VAVVALNPAPFVVFAASFFHPRTNRDWRAMGAFAAFLAALFTEMYGITLTVYRLGGPCPAGKRKYQSPYS
jgi:hypothetical protein